MSTRDAAQRVDRGVALAVAADDVAGGDDGFAAVDCPGARPGRGCSAWGCLRGSGLTCIERRDRRAAAPAGPPVSRGAVPRGSRRAAPRWRVRRRGSLIAASTRRCSLPLSGRSSFGEDARDVLLRAAQRDAPSGRRSPGSVRPSAISSSTSRSRGVRPASGPSARSAASRLRDDLGVERRAAAVDTAQRRDEVLDVGDAVLEQVAEPLGILGQHPRRDAELDVLGQDHDRDLRVARADRLRRDQALVGVRRRHPDVDDRDVGLGAPSTARSSSSASSTSAATSRPHSSQQRGDPPADEQVVVRDHDPHGSSAVTVVPAPAG